MRTIVVCAALVAAISFGLAGCGGGSSIQVDSSATVKYDPKIHGVPQEMGGPPPKGGSKGNKSGGGGGAPP